MTELYSCIRIVLLCYIILAVRVEGFRLDSRRQFSLAFRKTILPAQLDDRISPIQTNLPLLNENPIENSSKLEGDAFVWDWKVGALVLLPVVALLATGKVSSAFPTTQYLSEAIPTTMQLFDPSKFQPVCPASDGFYQVMKGVANTLIGPENVIEYGPLVASVLLRVRLELCVFESFVYEAVVPFIQQKGLSWILPLHETLETFLAGTIFAVASNFILLGSTKIITVLLIYFDALFGFPARCIGDLLTKWTKNKSTVNKAGNVLKFTGDVFGTVRKSIEVIDTFVGRYLVFGTTAYIIFKFLHYKFFNDLIPF
eukprot:gene37562-45621_t